MLSNVWTISQGQPVSGLRSAAMISIRREISLEASITASRSFFMASVERNGVVALRRLVAVRQLCIYRLDPGRLRFKGGFLRLGFDRHQLGNGKALPECILLAIAAWLQAENLFQDLEVMRNGKGI